MKKLDIVYQDKDIIVVNKDAHLLTIGTEKERDNTLYHKVLMYEKTKRKSNKIFIVHRLDKETSGLVLFAKREEIKDILQNNWDIYAIERKYVAVVEGKLKKKEDTLKNHLMENSIHHVYVSDNGKLAITKYKVLKESKSYSLLDIVITTGRKNQIRAQLSNIGSPIIGDKKYNAKTNPLRRLGLHANKLVIRHPITNEVMTFESKVPSEFMRMFHV
ncbi:MAG: RNA pseudouridine synthase [Bacillales bacterium]|nr:RNA pseudouridine synthase [Bacillales bacterium]